MKLLTLEIKGYKNLENVTLDFKDCSNYCALIGLNGSGKSNILEAISIIFSSLYHGTDIDFEYSISYEIDDFTVEIKREKRVSFKVNLETVKRNEYDTYLPSNIIACYSGEELRMWEHTYIKSYGQFFRDIKNDQNTSIPRLLYVNKYIWEFALIALLCLDKDSYPKIKTFREDILKINDNDVKISFDFDLENINDYPRNSVIDFIEELNNTQVKNNNELSIDQIQTSSYKVFSSTEIIREMFYGLFITGMPVKNKKAQINIEKIIRKTEVKFNNIDVKKLSEGEKKLILIYTITQLLADEKTLVLLDEPDAHIHIERKKEIIDIIKDSKCFTLFTTHSPTITKYCDKKNLFRIEQGAPTPTGSIDEAIEYLINKNALLKTMFSSKDIIICEGKTDEKYISKALELFSADFPMLQFDFLRAGGTDGENIKHLLDTFNFDSHKKVIILVDRDEAGRKVYNYLFGENKTENGSIDYKYYKDNVIYFMIPPLEGNQTNKDFQIENYFGNSNIREVVNKYIEENYQEDSAFTQLPNKLQQKIKEVLKNKCITRAKMVNFKTLLHKLKYIVESWDDIAKNS